MGAYVILLLPETSVDIHYSRPTDLVRSPCLAHAGPELLLLVTDPQAPAEVPCMQLADHARLCLVGGLRPLATVQPSELFLEHQPLTT